jgi:hypothetical protein
MASRFGDPTFTGSFAGGTVKKKKQQTPSTISKLRSALAPQIEQQKQISEAATGISPRTVGIQRTTTQTTAQPTAGIQTTAPAPFSEARSISRFLAETGQTIQQKIQKLVEGFNRGGFGVALGMTLPTGGLETEILKNTQKIGTLGKQVTTAAGTIAKNTSTLSKTIGLFEKIGLGIAATGVLISAIGSYPFAGFLKEEALQTLSFGVTSALRNNDVEGA